MEFNSPIPILHSDDNNKSKFIMLWVCDFNLAWYVVGVHTNKYYHINLFSVT